jgi:hypothetical protein
MPIVIRKRHARLRTMVVGHIYALCVATALLGGTTPADAAAPTAPALPPPAAKVIRVSTESDLQSAVRTLKSNQTILIAPGTYRLTGILGIKDVTNVALRGATGNRADVQIVGPGMTGANDGGVPYGVWTSGVTGILIANLPIRDFYVHPIILNAGTQAPHIYNVRVVDGGQQLLKSNPDSNGKGVDNGLVEYSVFEYTTTSRDDYTNGIDVHGGAGWIIRNNLFRNIRAPRGLAGPAILMWNGSRDTLVEGNTFINCQRDIAFGLIDRTAERKFDHTGGIIRNNFIYHGSTLSGGDVGIGIFDSPNSQVLHNTILVSGTYPNAIEYRFPRATGIVIKNNLTDAEIRVREGAVAAVSNNYTAASASFFVAPAAGDLHLTSSATAAIDKGAPGDGVATDWDGDPRPAGSAPDLGADELSTRGPTR